MTRAVILAAVSTEESDEKTQDPEVQVVALQDAARRLGWDVAHVLRFRQSRFDPASEREVQQAAIEALTRHKADVLMVEALDRIARGKPRRTLRFIEQLEDHHGFHFWSRREPFLSTTNEALRDMLIGVFAYIANEESGQKSERGKQKAAFKRQAAEKLGQRATWGRGKMPTMADRRKVWDLRDAGQTVRAIKAKVGLSLGTVHRILQAPRPVHQAADEQTAPPGGTTPPAEGSRLEQGGGA